MAQLPVPAKMLFNDVPFEQVEYTIQSCSIEPFVLKGIPNKDEDGKHIEFLYTELINIGDTIFARGKTYLVKNIEIDTYNNVPELIRVYF